MTVHYFNAYFSDESGKVFYGTIFWDKYSPRKLKAELYPKSGGICGYPIWSVVGTGTDLEGTESLVANLKKKAGELGLSVTSERFTEFSPVLK